MSVYYCPSCGNVTVCGKIEIFGSSFEEQEKVTKSVKKKIEEGNISLEEQKLCFICEEAERRRSFFREKIISGLSVVNSCVECFDLEINGVWQKFTHEQRGNLRKSFLNCSLYVNGEAVMECPSCVEIKAFVLLRTENVYNDSFNLFM